MQKPGQGWPRVPPGPVPTIVNVGIGEQMGQRLVVIEFSTPTGHGTYFLEPRVGEEVGREIIRQARAARVGLIIPQPNVPHDLTGPIGGEA